MNQILEQIVTKKKEDLKEQMKLVPLDVLKEGVKRVGGNLFYSRIVNAKKDPAIIAEVKLKSPGIGLRLASPFWNEEDLVRRVEEYEEAGADAVSIITEKHFFGGNIDFIKRVKDVVDLPVLQKDFVIDEYQIYESVEAGADAVLLIARLVDKERLDSFVKLVNYMRIEPVVEVYDEADLEKAVAVETRFVAVNARDLDKFEVNVDKACRLMKKIPDKFIKLGFSGVKSGSEVRMYREAGARGILVGTSLMKTKNIGEFLDRIKK